MIVNDALAERTLFSPVAIIENRSGGRTGRRGWNGDRDVGESAGKLVVVEATRCAWKRIASGSLPENPALFDPRVG